MGVGYTTTRKVKVSEREPLLKKQKTIKAESKKEFAIKRTRGTSRWIVVLSVLFIAILSLGRESAPGVMNEMNLQVEERHEHEASSAVQSRSIFTCVLCVIAALIILVPRLAWGPDDINGVAAGAGVAEEQVAKELGAGVTLLIPWLCMGVLYDVTSRSLLTQYKTQPFDLTLFECVATSLVASFAGGNTRPSVLTAVLGLFQFGFVSLGHYALSMCSLVPNIVSIQVCFVIFGTFVLGLHNRNQDDVLKSVQKLGVPNLASFFALVVALGGLSIIAIAETPAIKHCFSIVLGAQVSAGLFLLGMQHIFTFDSVSISQVWFQTSISSLVAAVIAWSIFSLATEIHTPQRAPVLALDAIAFFILTALTLIIIRRFSALVLLLFAALRSILSLFTQAGIYHDTLTALEYKGAMILVLGLAIYALEVSKCSLDATDIMNGLAPSRFLEIDEEEDEEQHAASSLSSTREDHPLDLDLQIEDAHTQEDDAHDYEPPPTAVLYVSSIHTQGLQQPSTAAGLISSSSTEEPQQPSQ